MVNADDRCCFPTSSFCVLCRYQAFSFVALPKSFTLGSYLTLGRVDAPSFPTFMSWHVSVFGHHYTFCCASYPIFSEVLIISVHFVHTCHRPVP